VCLLLQSEETSQSKRHIPKRKKKDEDKCAAENCARPTGELEFFFLSSTRTCRNLHSLFFCLSHREN